MHLITSQNRRTYEPKLATSQDIVLLHHPSQDEFSVELPHTKGKKMSGEKVYCRLLVSKLSQAGNSKFGEHTSRDLDY